MNNDNPWAILGEEPLDFSDGAIPNFSTPVPPPWKPTLDDLDVLWEGPVLDVGAILNRFDLMREK